MNDGKSDLMDVKLVPLTADDREQFILDNQEAFNYGALKEFGRRDDHFEEDEQIISRETIERSIDNGEAYRIMLEGRIVGGVIITVDGEKGDLDILFTSPMEHSKGVGYAAWCEVEKLHPEVKVWETVTPYWLKTIKDADRILVVSDGQIIESGTHGTLMEANGTYAHMISLQAS